MATFEVTATWGDPITLSQREIFQIQTGRLVYIAFGATPALRCWYASPASSQVHNTFRTLIEERLPRIVSIVSDSSAIKDSSFTLLYCQPATRQSAG